MPSKKRVTPISLQPLDALFGTNEETTNGISEIAIGSLHPFTNHPFQVRDDKKMEELAESITQYGVLVPGIVRLRESGGYELVAGHRRKRACELAGLEKMPVIIKDLTDDEATVIMVDSNIQREELLISEKAFAYKMKYEALKRQGKRSDLTSCQVGKKLAAEEVSQNTGDSSRQILRYIHLTELVAELLELADEKKLPFNTAVELSYLRTEEQQILFQYMSNHNMVPSMKQAKELKQISKERMLTYSEIDQICMNESTEKVQVQIPAKKLKQYFPETYTKTQMEEIIFKLLASWAEREGKELIATADQREMMYHKIREYRKTKPLFTVDFWNDGEYVGGCIAGGRCYCHINANGDIEPCAFIHYSDSNIREKTLLEAYTSPLFMGYHDNQPWNDNLLRPCPVLDNPGRLTEIVEKSHAKSTDYQNLESAKEFSDKCMEAAENWAPVADRLWEESHGGCAACGKCKMAVNE